MEVVYLRFRASVLVFLVFTQGLGYQFTMYSQSPLNSILCHRLLIFEGLGASWAIFGRIDV